MRLNQIRFVILPLLLLTAISCQKTNNNNLKSDSKQTSETDQINSDEVSAANTAPQITNITWQLLEIQSMDDTQKIPDAPGDYTLLLQSDSKVNIKADCNSGFGTYTLDGGSLTIKISGLTRAMCPPKSLSDEYVRSLNEVYGFILKDGYLYLSLKMDSGILKFGKG